MQTIKENDLTIILIYTFTAFLLMALVLVLFFYFSRKKIVQKEVEKKNLELSHQKKLLHAILVTQEEERKRIAQDLHDDISSKLNIVSINSHLLKTPGLTFEESCEISTNIFNLTKKALDNSRRIAHDLLPPVLEKFGLHAGIEEMCVEFNSNKQLRANFKSTAELDKLSSDVQLSVFRILQELMNNSLKHSKASSINIIFERELEKNICKYSDDGVGFDLQSEDNQKGLGMKSIESRVSFLNGEISVNSSLGNGINVLFSF
ncbi:sensor histidine kinase [Flavobacterium sp.]|uniref:sensor histidine kinase n=1 Tax=Flavobacterium sp. TaxID=239 RepID=UPI0040473A18